MGSPRHPAARPVCETGWLRSALRKRARLGASRLAFGPSRRQIPAGTTASADPCCIGSGVAVWAVGRICFPRPTCSRSPRIRALTFPLRPPHLRNGPSVVTGFTVSCRLTRTAAPRMRFVFLGAGFGLGLPSHDTSRCRSCLRLGVSTTASPRGLSPPGQRPCRAYAQERPRFARRSAPRVVGRTGS